MRDWQSALARTWATEHQDDWATLAVDGHVKVYAGRNGRLPKHFVARQKLCMPASVSYWINALGGTPLLCLHKALDPKLIKAIEHDVVPHLQQLGVVPEAAPDLTQPEAGAPALTLVFDRAGWSPDLFKRLARRGIACITLRKNFKGAGACHHRTPVNLFDEDDGTVLVTSPDFPELTTFGADRAEALAYAVGALEEAIASRMHARIDVPAPAPAAGDCVYLATLTVAKVMLYGAMRDSQVSKSELARRLNWHFP